MATMLPVLARSANAARPRIGKHATKPAAQPPADLDELLKQAKKQTKLDFEDFETNQLGRGASLWANVFKTLGPRWLLGFNAVNLLLSIPAIVVDIKDVLHGLHDPHATRADKLMNASLLTTDTLSAGASVIMLAGLLSNPIGLGAAIGLTAAGIAGSIVKVVYDEKKDRRLKKELAVEGSPVDKITQNALPVSEVAAQGLSILACIPVIGPLGKLLFVGSQVLGMAAGGAAMVWRKHHAKKLVAAALELKRQQEQNQPPGRLERIRERVEHPTHSTTTAVASVAAVPATAAPDQAKDVQSQ